MKRPLDRCRRSRWALRRRTAQGFSIVEVLVAVLIATGAMAVLVPALSNQLVVSRQASRLTAIEAIVSRDLYWFSNYARYWKMTHGIYSLGTLVTKTSSYNSSGFAQYDPPRDRCRANTLASGLMADAQTLFNLPFDDQLANPGLLPPFNPGATPVNISVAIGGRTLPATALQVNRRVYPAGNRLIVSYGLTGTEAASLRFTRVASIFIEASAWCDSLP
jgi:type II secretory pathway pseudopilin PulG